MSTPSDSVSTVDARLAESGLNAPCSLPPNEAERSLLEAMHGLVQQLGETNVHLLMLADQTVKCLAHISILIDLLMSSEEEETTDARTYLDGTPVS